MKTRSAAKAIKDLKDLRALRGCACYRHAGPKGPEEKGETFFTVARGPVPRERWIARARTLARETHSPARVETCEGPRPTRKGGLLPPRPR